jgi:hypothetical protein
MHYDQKYVFFLTDIQKYYDFEHDKIDIFISHFSNEYDQNGNYTLKKTKYNISRCDLSDFDNTDYERTFWKTFNSRKPYCIKDPNNTLSILGTRNNEQYNRSWSKFGIVINRCRNTNSSEETSNCSSNSVMDVWLEDKVVWV